MFEEKYDELVGTNNDCAVYLCKVVPRDVDVSGINTSIERVANFWRMHNLLQMSCSLGRMAYHVDGTTRLTASTCHILGQNG